MHAKYEVSISYGTKLIVNEIFKFTITNKQDKNNTVYREIFAHFALRLEGEFKTGLIESYIKDCVRK